MATFYLKAPVTVVFVQFPLGYFQNLLFKGYSGAGHAAQKSACLEPEALSSNSSIINLNQLKSCLRALVKCPGGALVRTAFCSMFNFFSLVHDGCL